MEFLTLQVRSAPSSGTSNETKTEKPSHSAPPPEPKKVAKAGDLYFRNPKSDPKLIQMEKKKVCCFWIYSQLSPIRFSIIRNFL